MGCGLRPNDVTSCNGELPVPVAINGVQFHPALELVEDLGITRQTLWRWRREGLVPQGHLLRNQRVVFTEEEAAAIRAFARRVEPARVGLKEQR